MRKNLLITCLAIAVALATTPGVSRGQEGKKEVGGSLKQSEELAKKYLDTFRESGVPTPEAVAAALRQAESVNTIPAWQVAARLANSYANVVDVLSDHYAKLYYASRSGRGDGNMEFISTAAGYEKKRNVYLAMRNSAYLRIAQLYLAKGDKLQALSLAVTAVSLSGAEPNKEGEALIRQIVEYKP